MFRHILGSFLCSMYTSAHLVDTHIYFGTLIDIFIYLPTIAISCFCKNLPIFNISCNTLFPLVLLQLHPSFCMTTKRGLWLADCLRIYLDFQGWNILLLIYFELYSKFHLDNLKNRSKTKLLVTSLINSSISARYLRNILMYY